MTRGWVERVCWNLFIGPWSPRPVHPQHEVQQLLPHRHVPDHRRFLHVLVQSQKQVPRAAVAEEFRERLSEQLCGGGEKGGGKGVLDGMLDRVLEEGDGLTCGRGCSKIDSELGIWIGWVYICMYLREGALQLGQCRGSQLVEHDT